MGKIRVAGLVVLTLLAHASGTDGIVDEGILADAVIPETGSSSDPPENPPQFCRHDICDTQSCPKHDLVYHHLSLMVFGQHDGKVPDEHVRKCVTEQEYQILATDKLRMIEQDAKAVLDGLLLSTQAKHADGSIKTNLEEIMERRNQGEINLDHARFITAHQPVVTSSLVSVSATSPSHCGLGKLPTTCDDGYELNGLLCYPVCKPGYHSVGCCVCSQNCPSEFSDIALGCQKPEGYGRGTGYTSESECCKSQGRRLLGAGEGGGHAGCGSCEKNGLLWYPKCREGFHAFGCCICSPNCLDGMTDSGTMCLRKTYGRGIGVSPGCPPGQVKVAGFCYEKCECTGTCPAESKTTAWPFSGCDIACPLKTSTGQCCKPELYAQVQALGDSVKQEISKGVSAVIATMGKLADGAVKLVTSANELVAEAVIWKPIKTLMGSLGDALNTAILDTLVFAEFAVMVNAPLAGIQANFFPDAISSSTSYTKNDWLEKQAQLTIALQVSGYKWEQTKAEREHAEAFFSPITPGQPTEPAKFCPTTAKSKFDFVPKKKIKKQDAFVETAVSLFTENVDGEPILYVTFRGSQTTAFADIQKVLAGKVSLESLGISGPAMFKNWIGTDLHLAPSADMFCGKPDVKMHTGWQNGYKIVRSEVIEAVKSLLAENPNMKVVIEGYSLGAGLAVMAAWDFTCNKHLGQKPVHLITNGTPITFYGRSSMEAYQNMIPVSQRIRIINCGLSNPGPLHLGEFKACDGVTANLAGKERSIGYMQPWDGDHHVVWTGDSVGTSSPETRPKGSCYGMLGDALPPFIHCHFLDQYVQGLQRRPNDCGKTAM